MTFDLYSWLASNPPSPRPIGNVPLTTVARARAWLSPDQGTLSSQSDVILSRLILAVSGLVMSAMNRDTLVRTVRTERYNSSQTGRLSLRNWPAFSLASVEVGSTSIPVVNFEMEDIGGGPQSVLALPSKGYSFSGGLGGVRLSYQSGFVKYDDLTIPAATPYVVELSSTPTVIDAVLDQSTMLPVAYMDMGDGTLKFDASLSGVGVRVVYSFVPEDIEQVVIDEVGAAFRSRQRIGEASKAAPNGAGTVSYLPRQLNDVSKITLNNYKSVAPI